MPAQDKHHAHITKSRINQLTSLINSQKHQQIPNTSTHQFTSSSTHKFKSPSTHQPTISLTQKIKTHQLTNSKAPSTKKLTSSPTHQLVNLSTG